MLTKRKIKIPIFNYIMHVYIFDEKDDLPYDIVKDVKGTFRGFTTEYEGLCDVVIKNKDYSTINHESLHITNNIWRWIGYIPQRDNDEVSAYLTTYIGEMITKVMNIHNSNKF